MVGTHKYAKVNGEFLVKKPKSLTTETSDDMRNSWINSFTNECICN